MPSRLWIIGLGNLGQAFAWLLACLPYEDPSHVQFVLQGELQGLGPAVLRAGRAARWLESLCIDGRALWAQSGLARTERHTLVVLPW